MKPRRTQKIEWSPNLAYAVGLITTDGNLSPDSRHIILVSKDIQLLKTFKRVLNLKNKISSKKSGYTGRKDCHVVQFGDVILYKWLQKIGLTPNKSETISKLRIPSKYFFDFLRGSFDGDGGSYSYWDPRWASSFMFYTAFNSGSLSYLKWLRNKLKKYLKISGHITKGNRAWKLCFAKKESKILFAKMYYQKNLPNLKRKYTKLKVHLETDDREINRSLKSDERVL